MTEGTPKRKRGRQIAAAVLALAGCLIADYWLYPFAPIGGRSHDQGRNGLWLRH